MSARPAVNAVLLELCAAALAVEQLLASRRGTADARARLRFALRAVLGLAKSGELDGGARTPVEALREFRLATQAARAAGCNPVEMIEIFNGD